MPTIKIIRLTCTILSLFLLNACGGGGGNTSPAPSPTPSPSPSPSPAPKSALDIQLDEMILDLSLTGDPATPRGLSQIVPDNNPMVKLGQILFFSQTFSGGYDVSCGHCHHPDFAMSDGLSISVGVVPTQASAVGPERVVDYLRDLDPKKDLGPNMHRHSITTLNAALMDRALLYDGRVRVTESENEISFGGHGQGIVTAETSPAVDADNSSGLLEFQAKGPMTGFQNEMRGYFFPEMNSGSEYREHLVGRLKGLVDTEFNSIPDSDLNWLEKFRTAFGQPAATADQLITMVNIQKALSAYVKSQIFIDSPWKSYVEGDNNALTNGAKRGALLFFRTEEEGGLGCAQCHSGDRLTDENFYNVGFPQLGRGFGRSDTSDFGRWLTTRREEDKHKFRAVTLLNIAETAPYGHAGSFDTLEETIRYHANPRSQIDLFDFSLSGINQFRSIGISYPAAEDLTRNAINHPSFTEAEALLPGRALLNSEVSDLLDFFEALSDSCVTNSACISQWAPETGDDPDGHLLVRNVSTPPVIENGIYPSEFTLNYPSNQTLATFADVQNCQDGLTTVYNTGQEKFSTNTILGLNDPNGYARKTWFKNQLSSDITMISGGVSSAYLTDDCWPDLVYTGGDKSKLKFYQNVNGSGEFITINNLLPTDTEVSGFTGSAFADLNGDYRREMLLGNFKHDNLPVFSPIGTSQFKKITELPMSRPTYGISFAPLDNSRHPYVYLSHWSGGSGIDGFAPALWKNNGGKLMPWDEPAQTTSAHITQHFNLTPKFADFTGDGNLDLVIASDFLTSVTLRHEPSPDGPVFINETDTSVITDENGMGSTLLDIDNDGVMEWFVTSIMVPDRTISDRVNWGISGNRLYRNVSTVEKIAFEDITEESGVRHGYWGWGACAADFNNDGFIDIHHVNGFGYVPDEVINLDDPNDQRIIYDYYGYAIPEFVDKPNRLFMNNGNGTFSEQAAAWDMVATPEGRGLTCMDYDRDGDIDIVVFDHSEGLIFFENNVGHGPGKRFINVRVVGAAPNTDALGTIVTVTADVGGGHGEQMQTRLSEASSNYNSQNVPDLHFGLGEADTIVELKVEWFNGETLTCNNVDVNQFIVLDERNGADPAVACP